MNWICWVIWRIFFPPFNHFFWEWRLVELCVLLECPLACGVRACVEKVGGAVDRNLRSTIRTYCAVFFIDFHYQPFIFGYGGNKSHGSHFCCLSGKGSLSGKPSCNQYSASVQYHRPLHWKPNVMSFLQ